MLSNRKRRNNRTWPTTNGRAEQYALREENFFPKFMFNVYFLSCEKKFTANLKDKSRSLFLIPFCRDLPLPKQIHYSDYPPNPVKFDNFFSYPQKFLPFPVGKIAKKTAWKYSAILSKIHSYRLFLIIPFITILLWKLCAELETKAYLYLLVCRFVIASWL